MKADDTVIERFEDIVHYVRSRVGKPIVFQVERAGQTLTLAAIPEAALPSLSSLEESTSGRLEIYGGEVVVGPQNPLQAIGLAAKELVVISWQTLQGVFQMLMGQRSMDGMGGPLMIAQLTGEIAQSGWAALLWFMALLSINLGLINLFPVPLLDGGHLFLCGIEVIRGKPLSEKALVWCYRLGLGVVLCLLLLTTWNDLHCLKVFQFLGTLLGV